MQQVETLVKTTLAEIERLLTTRAAVGEPMTFDGHTIIPLVSVGFGFGAGGGSGKEQKTVSGEGEGGGTGGGGGVRPVAVIVVSKDGVKVEPIRGGAAIAERLGEMVGKIVEKRRSDAAAS